VPVDVALDADGRLGSELACLSCGYNLRGLLPHEACPECGHSIAESVRARGVSSKTFAWLERSRRAMGWMTLGLIGAVVFGWAPRFLGITSQIVLGVTLLLVFLELLSSGAFVLGVWQLTRSHPQWRGQSHPVVRQLARWGTLVAWLIELPMAANRYFNLPFLEASQLIRGSLVILHGVSFATAAVCVALLLRDVASRIPTGRMSRIWTFAGAAMGVAFLCMVFSNVIMLGFQLIGVWPPPFGNPLFNVADLIGDIGRIGWPILAIAWACLLVGSDRQIKKLRPIAD
jgi:predicted RNA-binding Zn-ribbon protein involved in translation (DUF1610 family)